MCSLTTWLAGSFFGLTEKHCQWSEVRSLLKTLQGRNWSFRLLLQRFVLSWHAHCTWTAIWPLSVATTRELTDILDVRSKIALGAFSLLTKRENALQLLPVLVQKISARSSERKGEAERLTEEDKNLFKLFRACHNVLVGESERTCSLIACEMRATWRRWRYKQNIIMQPKSCLSSLWRSQAWYSRSHVLKRMLSKISKYWS